MNVRNFIVELYQEANNNDWQMFNFICFNMETLAACTVRTLRYAKRVQKVLSVFKRKFCIL